MWLLVNKAAYSFNFLSIWVMFLCEIHVLLVLFFEHNDFFVQLMHGSFCALVKYIPKF